MFLHSQFLTTSFDKKHEARLYLNAVALIGRHTSSPPMVTLKAEPMGPRVKSQAACWVFGPHALPQEVVRQPTNDCASQAELWDALLLLKPSCLRGSSASTSTASVCTRSPDSQLDPNLLELQARGTSDLESDDDFLELQTDEPKCWNSGSRSSGSERSSEEGSTPPELPPMGRAKRRRAPRTVSTVCYPELSLDCKPPPAFTLERRSPPSAHLSIVPILVPIELPESLVSSPLQAAKRHCSRNPARLTPSLYSQWKGCMESCMASIDARSRKLQCKTGACAVPWNAF